MFGSEFNAFMAGIFLGIGIGVVLVLFLKFRIASKSEPVCKLAERFSDRLEEEFKHHKGVLDALNIVQKASDRIKTMEEADDSDA
jgi:hypothetical protein